jgi:hypothetical protein
MECVRQKKIISENQASILSFKIQLFHSFATGISAGGRFIKSQQNSNSNSKKHSKAMTNELHAFSSTHQRAFFIFQYPLLLL